MKLIWNYQFKRARLARQGRGKQNSDGRKNSGIKIGTLARIMFFLFAIIMKFIQIIRVILELWKTI